MLHLNFKAFVTVKKVTLFEPARMYMRHAMYLFLTTDKTISSSLMRPDYHLPRQSDPR